jgi:hypothetical protein
MILLYWAGEPSDPAVLGKEHLAVGRAGARYLQ